MADFFSEHGIRARSGSRRPSRPGARARARFRSHHSRCHAAGAQRLRSAGADPAPQPRPGDHADGAHRAAAIGSPVSTPARTIICPSPSARRTAGAHPRRAAARRPRHRRQILIRSKRAACGSIRKRAKCGATMNASMSLRSNSTSSILLARSSGRIVSRDELAAALYQRETTPYERSLDVHMSHLRKKLEGGGRHADPHGERCRLPVLARTGGNGMRSVYTKMLVWCFGVLVLSLCAFVRITLIVSLSAPPERKCSTGWSAMEILDATASVQNRRTRSAGGISRQARQVSSQGSIILPTRTEKISSPARTAPPLIAEVHSEWGTPHHHGFGSGDRKAFHGWTILNLVVERRRRSTFATAPLLTMPWCWPRLRCSAGCSRPTSHLRSDRWRETVDRFGRGELSLRVHSKRRDEIGDLARSFDQMAERLRRCSPPSGVCCRTSRMSCARRWRD